MTFKVLIIEDNHSFIDSLKVMLRDLPLDFNHAFRYSDAIALIDKHGIFHNRQPATDAASGAAAEVSAAIEGAQTGKRRQHAHEPKLYNDGGVFLIIVEQNTESSMKGTDFISHAVRKYPALNEGDFILLTHRIEQVPPRNYNFPVLEKPLRAPQIRQIVQQKIKQAQETIDMQTRAAEQKQEKTEKPQPTGKSPRKGLRDLLKISRTPDNEKAAAEEKKPAKKKAAKKSAPAAVKKAKPK